MKKIALALLVGMLLFSCDNRGKTNNDKTDMSQKLKVFAVNYPLLYFAETIGGDHVEMIYPLTADADPAYWVPDTSLAAIQNADIILDNGADYAKWMEKVSLPPSRIVNTSEGFNDDYIRIEAGATHSHGAEGEHVHFGYAFTTWLDFRLAALQAGAVKEALADKMPVYKNFFQKNYDSLKTALNSLNEQMMGIGKVLEGKVLYASHPIYQYLERAYGLHIISMHWEPGELPEADQWNSFLNELEHHSTDFMVWEDEPGVEIREKLKAIGIRVVVFNPCANKPAKGSFIQIMNKNVADMQNALYDK